jgi:hypothetical protein
VRGRGAQPAVLTRASTRAPGGTILASDVYEWAPGGFIEQRRPTFRAYHERSIDGVTWEPSMEVGIRRA